MTGVAV